MCHGNHATFKSPGGGTLWARVDIDGDVHIQLDLSSVPDCSCQGGTSKLTGDGSSSCISATQRRGLDLAPAFCVHPSPTLSGVGIWGVNQQRAAHLHALLLSLSQDVLSAMSLTLPLKYNEKIK